MDRNYMYYNNIMYNETLLSSLPLVDEWSGHLSPNTHHLLYTHGLVQVCCRTQKPLRKPDKRQPDAAVFRGERFMLQVAEEFRWLDAGRKKVQQSLKINPPLCDIRLILH